MLEVVGLEPTTYAVQRRHSTTELYPHIWGIGHPEGALGGARWAPTPYKVIKKRGEVLRSTEMA